MIFRSGEEACGRIANWLYSNRIHYDQSAEQFPIVPRGDSVHSQRYPSHAQGGLFTIKKPFTMYRIPFSNAALTRNYDNLASENGPFFFSLGEAERHLLWDVLTEA